MGWHGETEKDWLERDEKMKRMAVEIEAWRRLRPEVAAFALMMEDRLRAHDHKSGWHRCAVGHLFGRLLDEAAELHHAIDGDFGDSDEEAADVANFAMMICDNLGGLNVDALMAERNEADAPVRPADLEE